MPAPTYSRRRALQWLLALLPVAVSRAAPAADRIVRLRIVERRVQEDSRIVRVNAGDRVELRWTSDEATTIHLHGYDIALALVPGVEAPMRFAADATGRYPISAHGFGSAGERASHREVVLVYLEVLPR
ncbi:MAG TPA: hypothetical protein VFC24_07295 [Casimicrobiaceae bacterium]|nr:hypothetical protein [Casimicrobiaceae bacterium]